MDNRPAPVDAAVKPPRVMRLRREGACVVCHVPLPAGTTAEWDPGRKVTTCISCRDQREPSGHLDSRADVAPPPPPPVSERGSAPPPASRPAAGGAGESAQREYERRRDKRDAEVRTRHPRLGGLILALSDEPQSTAAWAKGAEGERRVAQSLDTLRSDDVIVLHDRRIPRSKANIDHIVIASSGIHIVDAKRYAGRIELRGTGSIFRPGPTKLFVGGRDKTKLVEAMSKQVAVVDDAVADLIDDTFEPDVPLTHPALCFVDPDVGWFAKPMTLDGVAITWRTELVKVIAAPGPLSTEQVLRLGTRLAERLVPA